MANIIAVIWDCDKTLVDGYMQDPIFKDYDIDPHEFWAENDRRIKEYEQLGIRINHDTYYLNHFIQCAHDGTMPGLDNEKLQAYGRKQKFYKGIPEFFKKTKQMFRDDPQYSEYGIQVEHYIVSTGFAEVIRGSKLMPYVDGIWGCELIEDERDGAKAISEIAFTIDNTTKTRAIFEINKGIGKVDGIDVNAKVPKEKRRVQFENMIYIADGPSDIPAFSVVHQYHGATFAVYPKGDMQAMQQVEQMRLADRVDMFAEADYSEGTTANLWITNKINEFADRILEKERAEIKSATASAPHHLT